MDIEFEKVFQLILDEIPNTCVLGSSSDKSPDRIQHKNEWNPISRNSNKENYFSCVLIYFFSYLLTPLTRLSFWLTTVSIRLGIPNTSRNGIN